MLHLCLAKYRYQLQRCRCRPMVHLLVKPIPFNLAITIFIQLQLYHSHYLLNIYKIINQRQSKHLHLSTLVMDMHFNNKLKTCYETCQKFLTIGGSKVHSGSIITVKKACLPELFRLWHITVNWCLPRFGVDNIYLQDGRLQLVVNSPY